MQNLSFRSVTGPPKTILVKKAPSNVVPLVLASNAVCKEAQSELRDQSSSEKGGGKSDKGKSLLPVLSKEKLDKLFEKLNLCGMKDWSGRSSKRQRL